MAQYTYYRQGNKIIAVSSYAGKNVKGYAKCNPIDTFSNDIGKELAAARCNIKVAVKRRKNAFKKYEEAKQELYKAEARLKAMASYVQDAVMLENKAFEKEEAILKDIEG